VLDAFSEHLPLIALEEPRAGKNRALNRALEIARGALLVFTDDDVIVQPGWLGALHRASQEWTKANIFGGPILPVFPEGTPDWMSSPDFVLASEAFGSKRQGIEGYTQEPPYGANLAIRASSLGTIRFSEDVGPNANRSYPQGSEFELMMRMQRRGERFVHVPDAGVKHVLSAGQIETEWLLRRAERIGRGSARIKGKRVPKSLVGWIPLFFRLQRAQWVAYRARNQDDEERFERMQRVHYWRGYIAESRALRAEGARGSPLQDLPASAPSSSDSR
jgi:GT2 family glycosyltransferase